MTVMIRMDCEASQTVTFVFVCLDHDHYFFSSDISDICAAVTRWNHLNHFFKVSAVLVNIRSLTLDGLMLRDAVGR